MGNGASTGQGGNPTHGRRDVGEEADTEQPNWPELAEAPNTNRTTQPSLATTRLPKPYSCTSSVSDAINVRGGHVSKVPPSVAGILQDSASTFGNPNPASDRYER